MDDFALLQIVLITPQPIYYWTVESIKLGSEFGDVYYPNGWQFLAQLVFILVLYLPSFTLYVANRRLIATCVRRRHPDYDFEKDRLPRGAL